jgi:tetratricopeptide (TPR) repeat protein
MHALDDAEECVKLAPSWGKGYSRLGAAHFALRAYDDAIRVYEDGLKLEPSNEAMREGLEDAKTEKQRAQARASSGSGRPGACCCGRVLARSCARVSPPLCSATLGLSATPL